MRFKQNKLRTSMKKLLLIISVLTIFSACKNSGNGELVGVKNRPTFYSEDPFGMVFIPAGSYQMGASDQDAPFALVHEAKSVTVPSFVMDETEITNNEYRQFVEWVRDSIAHCLLGKALEDADNNHLLKHEDGENKGEVIQPNFINWKEKIEWDSKNEEYKTALEPMYSKISDQKFYHYRLIEFNTGILDYEYWWIDKRNFKGRIEDFDGERDATGGAYKEFDVKDKKTRFKGMFSNRPTGYNKGKKPFIRHEIVNIYPDTLVWIHDFTYSFNDPQTDNYFWHPAYDNYPVVGVSWRQAKAFSHWRTQLRNCYILTKDDWNFENDYRLPNESEWEWAARGSFALSPYPWGGPYTRNPNGCFLANFKPHRGRYTDDGGFYTVVVGHYAPNDYGLYDMAGNIAEWCEDAYEESAYNFAHDLNMQYTYDAVESDSFTKKRKVIRGGSWKDVGYYMNVATRTYEYQDTGKCYVGFRNVQSYLGRQKGDNVNKSSNVY